MSAAIWQNIAGLKKFFSKYSNTFALILRKLTNFFINEKNAQICMKNLHYNTVWEIPGRELLLNI